MIKFLGILFVRKDDDDDNDENNIYFQDAFLGADYMENFSLG